MKPLHLTGTPEHINVAVNALGRIALDPEGPNTRQQPAFTTLQTWMTDISDDGPQELAAYVIFSANGQLNWSWRRNSTPAERVDEWNLLVLQTCLLARFPEADELHTCWTDALNGYCTLGLNMDEQIRWAQWTLSSSMPAPYKTKVLSLLVPEVWLEEPIKNALLPLLPIDETLRFEVLPWAVVRTPTWTRVLSPRNHQDVNRELVAQYCPFAANLLHCMATPSQWSNRPTIEDMLAHIHASEQLDPVGLPDNLETA